MRLLTLIWIIGILLIILLTMLSCSKTTPPETCQNITIEKNNTIIQEVNITCPECKKVIEYMAVNISVPDTSCNKKLLNCITQTDSYRDELDLCLDSNSTHYNNNLEENLSDCYHDFNEWNGTWRSIIGNMNNTIIHLRLRLNESNITE